MWAVKGRYLGLDLSLTGTGVCFLSADGYATDTLTTEGVVGVERLAHLRGRLYDVLRTTSPTVVGVEGYAFGRANRAHGMGEWGGAARLLLWDRAVPTYLVPPSTMKKFITGRGDSEKSSIKLHLFKVWGAEVDSEDEADALGVALAVAHLREPGVMPALSRARLEALSKVTPAFVPPTTPAPRRRSR